MYATPISVARYLRIYHGYTQQRVAAEAGIDIRDLMRIEQGVTNLRVVKFQRLAEYYNVGIDDLLYNRFSVILPSLPERPFRKPYIAKYARENQRQLDEMLQDAQAYVAEQEHEKLQGTRYERGINDAFADDPDSPYDIQSFTPDGQLVFIVVKATHCDADEPFTVTREELDLARFCVEHHHVFEIHRLYHFQNPKSAPGQVIYSAEQILDLPKEPSLFTVRGC